MFCKTKAEQHTVLPHLCDAMASNNKSNDIDLDNY